MKAFAAALIVLMLLVSGCAFLEKGRGYFPGAGKQTSLQSLFFGKSTVTTEIMSPASGGKVPSSGSLRPNLRVVSYGEGTADGEICLTGLDRNIFSSASCDCQGFMLFREEDETFAEDELPFGPYSIKASEEAAKEHVLTALTRYVYDGHAKVRVCVSEEGYSCGARVIEEAEGPVSITSVEQLVSQQSKSEADITLLIEVENKDSGSVIREADVWRGCEKKEESKQPEIAAEFTDFPNVGAVMCEATQILKDKATLTCEARGVSLYDAAGNYLFESYNPEATLRLSYGYETAVSSKFTLI